MKRSIGSIRREVTLNQGGRDDMEELRELEGNEDRQIDEESSPFPVPSTEGPHVELWAEFTYTRNLGDYNSAKITWGVSVQADPDKVVEVRGQISKALTQWVNEEHKAISARRRAAQSRSRPPKKDILDA